MGLTPADYHKLGTDIDQMKENFVQFQAGGEKTHAAPKAEQARPVDRFQRARNGRLVPEASQPAEESAAARLQRQHEQSRIEHCDSTSDRSRGPVPPSPLDFPALSNAKAQSLMSSSAFAEDPQGDRRPSYANAASNGMMEAIEHAFSASRRSDQKGSDSLSDAQTSIASVQSFTGTSTTSSTRPSSTPGAHDVHGGKDDDRSVIVMSEAVTSSRTTDEPVVVVWKGIPSTPHSKAPRQGPHFAQPTKSFVRRAGETLRKDSSSVSPKSNGEVTPSRSVKSKEPTFVTDKRASQCQQKRKSLPGNWFNSSGKQPQHGEAESGVKAGKLAASIVGSISPLTDMASPSSADDWQLVEEPRAKESAVATKAKMAEPQLHAQPVRKKINSYMAPTSAATQRTLATLGQEKTKADNARANNRDLRIETRRANTMTLSPTQPDTASSDSSSIHFILDRPSLDAHVSPSRSCSKVQVQATSGHKQSLVQIKSADSVSSPSNGVRRDRHDGNPTKIPGASKYVEQTNQSPPSSPATNRSENLTSLRPVANTTTKRRTSNGHLLTPIVACLNAKGLLSKTSTKNAIIDSYPQGTGIVAREKPSASPERRSGIGSECVGPSEAEAPVRRVVPPHLRKARRASTSTDATLCPNGATAATTVNQNSAFQSIALSLQQSSNATSNFLTSTSNTNSAATSASLRATAQEFKPMRQPEAMVEELDKLETPDLLDYWADNVWSTMQPAARQYIQSLREAKRTSGLQSGMLSELRSPPRAPAKGHWGNKRTPPSADNAIARSPDEIGCADGVLAGQVLKPSFCPGKNNVQWMLQDVGETETPIKFGRAPPPTVSPILATSTPTVKASDDTSPTKTPYASQAWRINSASSPNFYGWKGGDGKEISFVGYGPHAERDPRSVVNFNFHGQTSSLSNPILSYAENIEEISLSEHIAPRSRRQWAEKLGLSKVPCGNMEITAAVEQIPFGSQLAGYCYDCMAK